MKIDQKVTKMQQQLRNKKRAGFTLVEVIAVTAMLGVLAAMLMPSISDANNRARNTKLHNDLTTIDHAIQVYKMDTGKCPETVQKLVDEGYIAKNKDYKDAKGEEFGYTNADPNYSLSGKDAEGKVVTSYGSAKAEGTTTDGTKQGGA